MAHGQNGTDRARNSPCPRRAAAAKLAVAGALAFLLSACAGLLSDEPNARTVADDQDRQPARTASPDDSVAALETDLTNIRERLIGLSSERINALFGTPSLNRAEPPSAIWQYRSARCTVDIFMFSGGGGTRVDHVDFRSADGAAIDEQTCFRTHLKQKMTQSLLEK